MPHYHCTTLRAACARGRSRYAAPHEAYTPHCARTGARRSSPEISDPSANAPLLIFGRSPHD
eukprot:7579529-Alexandrium_andersonii.AAC.1